MNKKICILILLATFLALNNALAQKSLQGSLESAVNKQGLTMPEFNQITTYYYKNPDPEKLIIALKAILSLDDLLSDAKRCGPTSHLMATVAHNDKSFYKKLESLKNNYSGLQKEVLESILKDAANFSSPNPDSAKNLDYLWAEFVATGSEKPVKKIISSLNSPPDSAGLLLIATAELSLWANARQHEIVLKVIKEESILETGQVKEKLIEILRLIPDATKNFPDKQTKH